MTLGGKISELRRSHGLTQADLGDKLGVTYQAVSKWERDESLPDFEMISRLARIFGVSLTYFESDSGAREVASAVSASTDDVAVLGTCTVCGRIIKEGEEAEGSSRLICKKCFEEQNNERMRREEEERNKRLCSEMQEKARFKKRVIIGIVISAIVSVLYLIIMFVNTNNVTKLINMPVGSYVAIVIVSFIMMLSWIFQLFFDGITREVTCWGLIGIKLPGIIFTADLDGLIFLIVMKVLLFIIGALISLALIVVTSVAGMIVGVFTLIPTIKKIARRDTNIL